MKNRLTIAKKFDCEDGMKGNEVVEKYIQEENRLVTNNPLGHRPQKDVGWNDGRNVEFINWKKESSTMSQKQKSQWRSYVLAKLDEENKSEPQ